MHFVRGDSVWLYDADGKRHLDAYNNVASVGHCHPRVVEAISRQASTLNTHTRYLHETVLDYTERVLATFPGEPGQAMLTCTGSEANDLAYRIVCNYTGGTGLIVTNFADHSVVAISQASPSLGHYVQRGPHVRTVRAPDSYRDAPGDIGAALLVDTVLSSDGVHTHPAGFLKPGLSRQFAGRAVFLSPMKCRPAWAGPGTQCGASCAMASCRTLCRWASRWVMDIRWRASLRSPNCSNGSGVNRDTSIRLAAIRFQRLRDLWYSMSCATSNWSTTRSGSVRICARSCSS